MRRFEDVVNSPDLIVKRMEPVNGYLEACLSDPKYEANPVRIIAGWDEELDDGKGVEHVSVSLRDRCPTMDEMLTVIDIFWEENVSISLYQSPDIGDVEITHRHPYCVHAFREKEQQPGIDLPYKHKNKPQPKDRAEAFRQDRDEALLSLNRLKILAFINKYNLTWPDCDEVMWAGIHKGRIAVPYFPEEVKEVSRQWLLERGFKTTIEI